ncbi:MAG: hypothetical protein ABI333_05045 [bacterium]
MSKRWSTILLLALVLSLAGNGFLLLRRGPRYGPTKGTCQGGPAEGGATCCAALRLLRQQHLHRVFRTYRNAQHGTLRRSPARTPQPPVPVGPSVPTAADTDKAAQRRALCEVAQESLRREWTRRRADLTASLVKSLGNREQMTRDLGREVDRFGDALGLTREDRERLRPHYRRLRENRFASALAALRRDPPDHRAVFHEAVGLFADQDRLVKELFGGANVQRLRSGELRSRTVVLALLAAQADLPWDDSIYW